ncbi:MAG: protein phosphatase 2C domain-containing protein [Muribaculaceae bacterium]|nr:serine/threonine-protein phosphatase [Bacteroides sp.]MDE6195041.1 protein phosphatase 2C domain-containing protein [Muribaculaceae bacterium]
MIIELDSVYSFHQLGGRDNQEDSRYPDSDTIAIDCAAFAVCDGVGGCEKGEVASATVCRRIGKLVASHRNTDLFTDQDFRYLLTQCYSALDEVSDKTNRGMGTTLTFLAFHSGGVLAAHIGDSRIYQIRPNEGIIYRSEDHSLVNSLLRSGNISPDEVRNHPKGNVITRCMSATEKNRERDDATVVNLQDVAPGDYFLMCTDGVSGNTDDEGLIDIYSSDRTDEDKYMYLAERSKDSSDNNTAIQIHIGLVTIDPQRDDDEEEEEGSHPYFGTQRLLKKAESSHEISAVSPKPQSVFKSLFNRLFK